MNEKIFTIRRIKGGIGFSFNNTSEIDLYDMVRLLQQAMKWCCDNSDKFKK